MSVPSHRPLQVGVIGLGAGWRRYRSALRAEKDRFAVRLLYDEVAARARAEALSAGCEPAASLSDLFKARLDAVLILSRQWFGLHALEQACGVKRPVYCAPPLGPETPDAEHLGRRLTEAGVPVLMERWARQCRATRRLEHLCAKRLGPARLLVVEAAPLSTGDPLLEASESFQMVDWCLGVMGSRPQVIRAVATPAAGSEVVCLQLEFDAGRAAQITVRRGGRPRCVAWVRAERGDSRIVFPSHIGWQHDGRSGRDAFASPLSPERRSLRHLWRLVKSGATHGSDLSDLLAASRVLDQAAALCRPTPE